MRVTFAEGLRSKTGIPSYLIVRIRTPQGRIIHVENNPTNIRTLVGTMDWAKTWRHHAQEFRKIGDKALATSYTQITRWQLGRFRTLLRACIAGIQLPQTLPDDLQNLFKPHTPA